MLLFSSAIGFMFRTVSYNTYREDSTCGDTRNKGGRMYDTVHDDVLFQVPTFRITLARYDVPCHKWEFLFLSDCAGQ